MSGILAKKIGMTRVYDEKGNSIPVTVVEAGPCKIVEVKNVEKHGYSSIALAFGKKNPKKLTKAMRTIYEKAGMVAAYMIREFKVENSSDYKVGQDIAVDSFSDIGYVDVSGTSKGKGFQGVIKRHNFAGGPKSHGATKFHRRPGSIGNFASSGRVFPGKKMPGQMGNKSVTVQNIKVFRVDQENNILLLKGAIPGHNNGYLIVKPALKRSVA